MLPDDIGEKIDAILVVKTEKYTLCHGLAILMGFDIVSYRALRLSGVSCSILLSEPLIVHIRGEN